MQYKKCSNCGANLDHGERCACEKKATALDTTKGLIVVEQLPKIVAQLDAIKPEVDKRVAAALSLACTEDTVKAVKAARAELNKEFQEFEDARLQAKRAILAPYEVIDAAYKDCVEYDGRGVY